MSAEFKRNDQTFQTNLVKKVDHYQLTVNEEQAECHIRPLSHNYYHITINGIEKKIVIAESEDCCYAHVDGIEIPLDIVREESDGSSVGDQEEIIDGKQIVKAPMPGKVVKVPVTNGQEVEEGSILCIVEAMKMEHEIRAKLKGTVANVSYKADDLIGTEETILVVEAAE